MIQYVPKLCLMREVSSIYHCIASKNNHNDFVLMNIQSNFVLWINMYDVFIQTKVFALRRVDER